MFVGASEIEKKNIVVRVHTKNYGKTRKTKGIYKKTRKVGNLCGGARETKIHFAVFNCLYLCFFLMKLAETL